MTFKEFFLERKSGPHHQSLTHTLGTHITKDGNSLSSISAVHKKKKNPKLEAAKNGSMIEVTPEEMKNVYGITDLNDPRLKTTGLVPNGKNPNVVIIKNNFGKFFIKRK